MAWCTITVYTRQKTKKKTIEVYDEFVIIHLQSKKESSDARGARIECLMIKSMHLLDASSYVDSNNGNCLLYTSPSPRD